MNLAGALAVVQQSFRSFFPGYDIATMQQMLLYLKLNLREKGLAQCFILVPGTTLHLLSS